MIELFNKQEGMRKKRRFYTLEEKQIIMRYVQRLNPKQDDPNIEVYKPPIELYISDMALMMNHIFSYEFKTATLKKEPGEKKPAVENPYDVTQNMTFQELVTYKIHKTKLYRSMPNFPPKSLDECETWFDVAVYKFRGDDGLASINFVIERQEETLPHELNI